MTSKSTEDVSVPDALADILRRAAAGVPADPPGLDEVRRRHRKRQLHRSFTALTGIGVLVAAAVVTPRLLAGPVDSTTHAGPAPSPTAEPLVQQLLLTPAVAVRAPAGTDVSELPVHPDPAQPNYGFPPGTIGVAQTRPWAVTPAGEKMEIYLPVEDHRGFHIFGGGRVVALEWRTLSGAPRYDGLCGHDAADYLRWYEKGGEMSLSRDIRVRCEETSIVGGTETEVFVLRVPYDEQTLTATTGRRLVAYSLADGSERTVADLDALPAHLDTWDVNVAAGRIVVVEDTARCEVQTLDIGTGVVTTLDLTTLVTDCAYVDLVRLSLDGSRLAFAYRTGGPATAYDARLAVVDLAGPAQRLQETVQSAPPAAMNPGPWGGFVAAAVGGADGLSVYYPAGIAWSDDRTVQFAWLWLPDDLDRVVGVEEVLNVRTFTVP